MTREPCAFCKIEREAEDHLVFEDPLTFAFLDHRPLFPGHTLLVPRGHYETFVDLPPALVPRFFANARLLVSAVERAFEADGSFLAINNRVSQSVPHLHLHIVPRRHKDGFRGFFWPRQPYQDSRAMAAAQAALRAAIEELQTSGAQG